MSHYYTNEINTLILISLLKAHNIKKIIASPGTTNISFIGSVQFDPFFKVYSAVDERSAAYMACGLAEESGEPVVLSCTGATASRNYLPGLTEAYYRKLPVLAVTSTQHSGKVGNYVAQVLDRTAQFKDLVKKSIQLNIVYSDDDKEAAITNVNNALLELMHNESGPVHINLFTTYSNEFTTKELPEYRVIKRVMNKDFPTLPAGKIAVFVGSHIAFTKEETTAIEKFCENNNAVVICDHISNYHGKYRFLCNLVNSQEKDFGTKKFDLIIYIGYIHGAYLEYSEKQLWRVNRDGIIRDPRNTLTYVFEMEEIDFFKHYSKVTQSNSLIEICKNAQKEVYNRIPELPFSNMWIAKETAMLIPNNSVIHFSILNSLRTWNYFEVQKNILCYANTGGYGIDGCLSSFIGSALANQRINHYIIIGDLSFFYDINVILNNMPSNVHILLINNGVGTEFKNYNHRAAHFGDDADKYMAAKGHNGYKNPDVVKDLCIDLGIKYLCANNKEEYLSVKNYWINSDHAVLLEVFTSDYDESKALYLMNNIAKDTSLKTYLRKSLLWKFTKKILKGR